MNISSVSDSILLKEWSRRFTIQAGESITSSKEAANHFRVFFVDAAKREKFVVCFLNGQHQVLATEVLFEGSLTTSAVYPREVLERVIELGSAAVVLSHNHPSGGSSITPSNSDRSITKKLSVALESIDVQVLDHIIIGGAEYFSFSDHRLI